MYGVVLMAHVYAFSCLYDGFVGLVYVMWVNVRHNDRDRCSALLVGASWIGNNERQAKQEKHENNERNKHTQMIRNHEGEKKT